MLPACNASRDDPRASAASNPAVLNASEAKLRALEQRLTGGGTFDQRASAPPTTQPRTGRPPLSPRNLHRGAFQTMPGAARETTTDSSQPGAAPAARSALVCCGDPCISNLTDAWLRC